MAVIMRQVTRCLASLSLVVTATPPVQPSELSVILGLPDWLDLSLDFTAEPMSGLSGEGEDASSSSWFQQTSAVITLGTGVSKNTQSWNELDHWQVQVGLNHYEGNADLSEQLGSFFPLQALVNPQGLWITKAALMKLATKKPIDWTFQAGVISFDDSIMRVPALDNYINATINTPYNIAILGYPVSPFSSLGGQIGIVHQHLGVLEYGYYQVDTGQQIAAGLGVNPQIPKVNGTVQVVQWSINPLADKIEMESGLRVELEYEPNKTIQRQLPKPLLQLGGYMGTTKLQTNKAKQLGDGTNNGAYGSIIWPVTLPIGIDNRVWLSGTISTNPENNPLESYAAGGWLSQGILPGRPLDVLALGLSLNNFSSTITPNRDYEGAIELNYTVQISDQIQFQPLMQWILNPSGTGSFSGIWATGAQLNISL